MKTRLTWILFALIAALALAACRNPSDPAHVHQWDNWVETIAPTCTTAGEEQGTCATDSATTTRPIPIDPTKHVWGAWTVITEPTCEATGIGNHTCTLCAVVATDQTIPALGHQWGNWEETLAPACETAGEETRTCSRDPLHQETNPIDATGHDWDWLVTNSNAETGLKEETKTCARCHNTDGTRTSFIYDIGDTGPGGGKIFYRDETGFTLYQTAADTTGITAHYLEVVPADMGVHWWASSWDYANIDIAGTETAIGTGMKNTAIILSIDIDAPAAKACNDSTAGGKTDWFLPSKDELNELYVQRNIFADLSSSSYWSSSQSDSTSAWSQDFRNGNQISNGKSGAPQVRAVRAF